MLKWCYGGQELCQSIERPWFPFSIPFTLLPIYFVGVSPVCPPGPRTTTIKPGLETAHRRSRVIPWWRSTPALILFITGLLQYHSMVEIGRQTAQNLVNVWEVWSISHMVIVTMNVVERTIDQLPIHSNSELNEIWLIQQLSQIQHETVQGA